MNARNGIAVDGQTLETYKKQKMIFRSRYRQSLPQGSEQGLVRLTGTQIIRRLDPSLLFNTGL